MQTELPREKLTKKAIRTDIREFFHSGMIACALVMILLVPLCFWRVWLIWTSGDRIPPLMGIGSILLFILAAVFGIVCVTVTVRYALLLYGKERYYITTAKLVHIEDKIGDYYGRYSEPYILTFSTNGEYAIPPKSYNWSKMYNLSYDGFYNYSHIGDEFYLVVDKHGKILVAYNTKLFELQEK